MAIDSQSTNPPSSITGMVPFGFIARNQGSSTLPQGSAPREMWPSGPIVPLARVSSNSTPTSTKAQSTRLVQIEFGRPQILIMSLPCFECCRPAFRGYALEPRSDHPGSARRLGSEWVLRFEEIGARAGLRIEKPTLTPFSREVQGRRSTRTGSPARTDARARTSPSASAQTLTGATRRISSPREAGVGPNPIAMLEPSTQ